MSAPLKSAYRDRVERLERGGVDTIGKQYFTFLYNPAREAAFTKRNIVAGWSKGRLFPLNPQRVLKDMQKPTAESSEATVGLRSVPCRSQHNFSMLPEMPVTPVTPVTAEAFMSLRNLIVEQDAHAMEDIDRHNLRRHLQKLTKAAQTSIARGILQQERIQFLLKVNNGAKVRRSTKSIVLGKARVMSYEDLVAARAKRMEKEASKAAKTKRARKRKDGAQTACVPGISTAAAPVVMPGPASILLQIAEARSEESLLAPCPGRASVARMW